jgi:predicted metal-binding membrane protein
LTGRLLRHERLIVAAGITLLVGLSWWFLVSGAGMGEVTSMTGMQPPLGALILMWWLMMVAMMLPSAAPAILLYAKVREQRRASGAIVQPWVFAASYLAVWLAFSVIAAMAQRLAAGEAMKFADGRAVSGLLIAAGLYQLSPLKGACLRQCRSPAQFLSRHWRPGTVGTVRLGLLHGAYCVGCCWLLMALLFVGGVMNFAWIAALTLIVAVEKLVPRGEVAARVTGIALIGWGASQLLISVLTGRGLIGLVEVF